MANLLSSNRRYVVCPSGHLNAATAEAFQQDLETVLRSHAPLTLILDMAQVDSLDSAGLMVLVKTLNFAQARNSTLMLCAIPASVQIILELTQLNQVFDIIDERPVEAQSPEVVSVSDASAEHSGPLAMAA